MLILWLVAALIAVVSGLCLGNANRRRSFSFGRDQARRPMAAGNILLLAVGTMLWLMLPHDWRQIRLLQLFQTIGVGFALAGGYEIQRSWTDPAKSYRTMGIIYVLAGLFEIVGPTFIPW